jgi:hypothetical protein
MESIKGADMPSTPLLTQRQIRCIEKLPNGFRIVNKTLNEVTVRQPDGRLLRIQRDGRLAPSLRVERVQAYLQVHGA